MKDNLKYLFLIVANIILSSQVFAQTHDANLAYLKNEQIAKQQIKILNNSDHQIPIVELASLHVASVDLGFKYKTEFDSIANKYLKVSVLSKNYSGSNLQDLNALNDDLKVYNMVMLKLTGAISPEISNFVLELEKLKKVIIVQVGAKTPEQFKFKSVVVKTDQNTAISSMCLAQVVFGGISLTGNPIRLAYSVPEAVGINTKDLDSIPLIVQQAIDAKGAPGAVVLVIIDGTVIFDNAYGFHKYSGTRKMKADDIFDMASVTKLAATTNATMSLYDSDKLSIDSPIANYIAKVRNMPEKQDIKVKEVLLHQAGFYPYIKFYEKLKANDTDTVYSVKYPTKLADGYYLRANYYNEIMWPEMLNDKVLTRGKYIYSDLSMYYMKEIVEKVSITPLNIFTMDKFYAPLGMQRAGFLPRDRFEKDEIVPTTENDGWLRAMPVQGFVNDPGAAMLGGVSGHAGFFASANDMGILGQMWLHKGTYGGSKYLKPETVTLFTSKQSDVSRRGLGFDRKDDDPSKGYPSKFASEQVFGHTGYTGTAIWVDPKYNLVYVFLSNRVYPDDKNKSLNTLNIRSRIFDVIYRAINKK